MARIETSRDSHVEVRESGDASVVALVGEFDLDATGALGRELAEPVNRGRDLVIDVTGVELIDSTNLGVLITAERRTSFRGRRFALVVGEPTAERVRSGLRMTGLVRTAETYPTVERALQAIGGSAPEPAET